MSLFKITREKIEGRDMWLVSRRDGQSFHGGILSLNFELSDVELAIAAAKKLEQGA
jgi:hypothetical protein